MTQWDKLLERILCLSKDMRFDELKKVLESHGYRMRAPKGGGSHCTFRKPGCAPITIPRHTPIKKAYIQVVRHVVESEMGHDDGENR